MNSFISKYLSWEYLSGVSTSDIYQKYLLYFILAMFTATVLLKIYLKVIKRSKAYIKFDQQWFWGFFVIEIVGLFLWFSVTQSLPTLGSRIAVYLWLFSIVVYKVYLYIHFKKVVTKEVEAFNQKKRKEKYLH
jgi:hypothetical protein